MKITKNIVASIIIGAIVFCLAGCGDAPTNRAASGVVVAAPVDDAPKTLAELNAMELERDRTEAEWCLQVMAIGVDYRDLKNTEQWGARGTVTATSEMQQISARLVKLRLVKNKLDDLNRRINAALDRVHK